MASVNKWIGIGNLGADPETRYSTGGEAVCNFRIACSESWKDKATGEKKEFTEWVRITAFGKLAEICGQYLKKGSSVYIEGSIRTNKWQDKDGQDRYTTEIRADEIKMLGKREAGETPPSAKEPAPAPGSRQKAGDFSDMDDDIPF